MACSVEEMKSSNRNTDEEEQQYYCNAMQLAASSVLPMVMKTAMELDLFRIIAEAGQASASEIASQLATTNEPLAAAAPAMLDRVLYFLTAHSLLSCSALLDNGGRGKRVYSLTPVSKYFVPDADGISLSPFLTLIQDKVFMDSWSQLKNSIREGGIPFNRVHGVHAFEYPAKNPRFNNVFNTAMLSHTIMVTNKIVESYKAFGNLRHLVDVGGGVGITLGIITSKYPTIIKAVNYDLPHVIQHAVSYPGVEHIGGNMFERVPDGEAIFLKWILHDWSDEECLKLLKNCNKALPDNGMVIVVEGLLPEIPETSASVQALCDADLVMMTQNPGGKERTRQEFVDLAMACGFAGVRVACHVYNYFIMEFFK